MAIPPGSPGTSPGSGNDTSLNVESGALNVINPIPGSLTGANTSGSTSNSSGWIPDLLTVFQEAAELANVDMTAGYNLRSVKRSYDLLASEWANEGLNLWVLDSQSLPLMAGNPGPYALPLDAMDVLYGAIRTTSQGQQIDIIIPRFDFASYLSIPNKLSLGRPVNYFINRLSPQPQIYFWLTPDTITPYTFFYYRLRRMQNSGNVTNTPDLPYRFLGPLTNGLAWKLALKAPIKNLQLVMYLEGVYRASLLQAKREDRDRASVFLQPMVEW